ncbi:MAG: hypothetical protein ACLR8Y_02955 [Alistipes indistinctus]
MIEWIDLAGLIVPSAAIDRLLDEVDAGRLAGFEILEQHLRKLDTEYSGWSLRGRCTHWKNC